MKKYLLFACDCYSARGGMDDCICATNNMDELINRAKKYVNDNELLLDQIKMHFYSCESGKTYGIIMNKDMLSDIKWELIEK